MRTRKELIQLLLDKLFLYTEFDIPGLCRYLTCLFLRRIISVKELTELEILFKSTIKERTIWNRIFYSKAIIKEKGYGLYCWKPREIEPRRRFLEYLLKKV